MRELKIGDLTVSLPIIQGGMGVGFSLSSLASAVANQGGVGVISAAAIGIRKGFFCNFFEANVNAQIAIWSNVYRAKEIVSVKELIKLLMEEYKKHFPVQTS